MDKPVTGLIYMRHRWYDPGLQRFISRDPIGFGGGTNPYEYGNNSPLHYVDPFGTVPVLVAYCERDQKGRRKSKSESAQPEIIGARVKNSGQVKSLQRIGIDREVGDLVPVFVPPLEKGEDCPDTERLQSFIKQFKTDANLQSWTGFANFWKPKDFLGFADHDYKHIEARYDAFGNYMYGITGKAAGYTDSTLLNAAQLIKLGKNHPVNQKDIRSAIRFYNRGCRFGVIDFTVGN